jgi:hypothetical protein
MKRIGDPSFFRLVERLVDSGDAGRKRDRWPVGDSSWQRERHSFAGAGHGFSVEIMRGTRPGPKGWELMVVKEYWWQGEHGNAFKVQQWAHLCSGRRDHLMDWLKDQQRGIDAKDA